MATLAQLGKKLDKLSEEIATVNEDLSDALSKAQELADEAVSIHQELVDAESDDDD